MSRRTPRHARLAAALLAAFSLLAGCGGERGATLWRIEKQPFVHQIRAEGVLRAASSLKLSVPLQADQGLRLAWLAEDGQPVAAGEVVARFDRQAIDKQLEDGRRSLQKAELGGRRAAGEDAIERGNLATTHRGAVLDGELAEKFQQKDETVFSRRQIAESSIDRQLAQTRTESAAAALGSQERLARAEADLVAIEKRKAALEIGSAEKGLEALEVRAPHAGLFLRGRLGGRGERIEPGTQMWPGMAVGELPQAGELQAEVYVLEADAGGLAEGQEAEVRIESEPHRLHRARISRVDASARPRFRGSPVQYFAVTLSFEQGGAVPGKLGQQVSARLVVDRRDAALVVPRQAILQVEGKSMVEVQRGGKAEKVEVRLGPAAAGRVVVESGLAEGDLVVLPSGGAEPAAGPAPAAGAAGAGGGR